MSINSYLTDLASDLVLSSDEKSRIGTSIDTLSRRLDLYFNNGELHKHFQFGSSTRGTILPRKADSGSDIDYMVVFKNPNNYKPNTLLGYLKKFMEKYYSTSEIYRDSPTMVLELNHIKFELVPAIQDYFGNLSIPSKLNLLTEWISTDPTGFNKKLTDANTRNSSKLKPVIRLMKYWNRGKLKGHYSSYGLEERIVNKYTYCPKTSVRDYVYEIIESLSYNWDDPETFKNKLNSSKEIIKKCKEYESNNMPYTALSEIKKLFPEM
ncbi:MAG: hypothetical protein PHU69_08555 [Fermentimonas sp.]|nr:hypothetical protein [Fermentimonas sp.]